MNRRDFIKTCSTVAVLSAIDAKFFGEALASQSSLFKTFNKVLLVKQDGTPITEEDIKVGNYYLFFYPFASTPCYILNLGEEVKPAKIQLADGTSYDWIGGVGSKKSIVAYSAICSHQWSYPTKDYAFINYYSSQEKSQTTGKSNIIQCCAHLSVFDPKEGGKVIEGPAPVPLASIVLSYEDGKIYATGVLGKDQFSEFFDNFKSDLKEQYGTFSKAKKEIEDKTVVMEVKDYVKEVIKC